MRIAALVATMTALVAAALPASQPNARDAQTVFRTRTDVVIVPVAVTRGRNPVPGLDARDFELFDNGVRQRIEVVDSHALPIDVTVVLGAVPQPEVSRLEDSRVDANRLGVMLAEGDRLRVVSAGARPHDRVPLQAAVTAPPLEGPFTVTRGSSDHDALFYAVARPAEPDRRHLVIMFTRADDTWSTLGHDRLRDLTDRADAVIHVVFYDPMPAYPPALRGPEGTERPPQGMSLTGSDPPPVVFPRPRLGEGRRSITTIDAASPARVLRRRETHAALLDVARRTGGRSHLLANDVAVFQEILDEFRSSYLLRYTLEGVERSGWHDIEVRVTRPGSFDIRARQGYEAM